MSDIHMLGPAAAAAWRNRPKMDGRYVSLDLPEASEIEELSVAVDTHRRIEVEPFARDVVPDVALDLRILEWLQTSGVQWYMKARSFFVAHRHGLVSRRVRQERWGKCVGCPSLHRKDDVPYCRGGGCGCGEYQLSRLTWKLRLANWSCPLGKFGKHERKVVGHGS